MDDQKVVKRWLIFCEPCSYKQIIEKDPSNIDDLTHVKTVKIPGGSPKMDVAAKKVKSRPDQDRPEMFKCPKCGRGVIAKKLPDVYVKAFKNIDEEEKKRNADEQKLKRLLDGKPEQRKSDKDSEPEFTG